jgi:uncharacterized protein YggE
MIPLRLAVVIPLLLMAALLASCSGDTIINSSTTQLSGITVSGTGRAAGPPDVVVLTLGVSLEAQSVATARESAAAAMQRVIDSLKSNGVADRNIQTTHFSIQPQYDFTTRGQTLRGYRVSNVVTARISQIDNAGRIIDSAATAGGDSVVVQSIQFKVENQTELQNQAREEAMRQARERAEQLARTAGVRLVRPIKIDEGVQPVLPQFDIAARTAQADTPIEAGELQITVNVTVTYAIE